MALNIAACIKQQPPLCISTNTYNSLSTSVLTYVSRKWIDIPICSLPSPPSHILLPLSLFLFHPPPPSFTIPLHPPPPSFTIPLHPPPPSFTIPLHSPPPSFTIPLHPRSSTLLPPPPSSTLPPPPSTFLHPPPSTLLPPPLSPSSSSLLQACNGSCYQPAAGVVSRTRTPRNAYIQTTINAMHPPIAHEL